MVLWHCVLIFSSVLGGSGVVISGVISLPIWVIIIVTLFITLVTKSHDPLSRYEYRTHNLSRQATGTEFSDLR